MHVSEMLQSHMVRYLLDPVPGMAPYLKPLGLGLFPKGRPIGLIPNVDNETRSSRSRINISEYLSEKLIVISPVAIISREGSCRVFSSIGPPEITQDQKEGRVVIFACRLVVAQSRLNTDLLNNTKN